MDDFKAVRRLKQGDIGGLELLIARHQTKAVRTAFLVTHDEQMAEDVVQDAYIRFFQRVRHFDETRPFEPYFMRSVVNAALNAIQKEFRIVSSNGDGDLSVVETLLAQAGQVESQVEFAQLKREILEALSGLPPRQRAVIVQRYYLDMSEREMAQKLEIAPGTVKWLLHSARSRLRSMLKIKGAPNEQ